MGQAQEQAQDELRQTEQVHQAVLQEGNHEEDRQISAFGLPVLFGLLPLKASGEFAWPLGSPPLE